MMKEAYASCSAYAKAVPMLFLWRLKDLAVIGIGALISVLALSQVGF